MDVSPAMKTAVGQIAEFCFEKPKILSSSDGISSIRKCLQQDSFRMYTPETYYYILHSLVERCVLVPGAAETFFQNSVPPYLQLAWRTQRAWLNGEKIQLYRFSKITDAVNLLFVKMTIETGFDYVRSTNDLVDQLPFELLLLKSQKEEGQPQKTEKLDESNAHCIDYLCWSVKKKESFMRVDVTHVLGGVCFTFLLAPDHGLDLDTRFFIQSYHEAEKKTVSSNFSVPLKQFTSSAIVNSSPIVMKPRLAPPESAFSTPSLHILKCLESEDCYELKISLREFVINSLKGKL